MSPRLLQIATDLAAARLAIPAEWTMEDCQKAVNNLDRLIITLAAHSDAIEEATGNPCPKSAEIAIALMDQMEDIEEAMKTR
jgi:hypothetical protein